jgi:hypothetical protein
VWIKALFEAIVLLLQQLGYVEKKVDDASAKKQTPEAKYAKDKEAMDEALAKNDVDSINLLTNDVLPPPTGSGDPKR